ncbi:CinA family protein [Spirochaetota bacterium]
MDFSKKRKSGIISKCISFLIGHGISIAVSESVTGGLLASSITSFPGSSAVFSESYVVYSDNAKKKVLHLEEALLEKHGVYSLECVKRMAENTKNLSGADITIATSGIAGPDGGTERDPVGTVYFDIFYKTIHHAKRISLTGNRDSIREKTVIAVLGELSSVLGI